MRFPFTHSQFLDVFGAYNRALGPAALILWLLTVGALWWVDRGGPRASKILSGILALHWGWAGVAYHWLYFRSINPAAGFFGGLFIAEAAVIAWLGVHRTRLTFQWRNDGWGWVAGAFMGFALVYPVVGPLTGMVYPRAPSFGVPCPTTILTLGAMLLAPRRGARLAAVVPLVWAGIGSSAAFALGIFADWVLVLAGGALLIYLFHPSFNPAAASGRCTT